MSGVELIAAERQRQIEAEGWAPEHDDEHDAGELRTAAECYIHAAAYGRLPQSTKDGVRRVIERHGGDPDVDEDYQRMLENPARHAFGWNKAPKKWPWDRLW